MSVSQQQEPGRTSPPPATRQEAVAVISAYGAFRLLIVLLAIWSFIEGFALFTGSFDALTLGGHDRTAEQVVGAQMIVLVPVYSLLAWRRERYRLLIWVPYGAQLAIILPLAWSLLKGNTDGLLMLIVSLIFFVLLFYFWYHSHPLDFFQPGEEEAEEEEDGKTGEEADERESEGDAASAGADRPDSGRGRRYRRQVPK